MNFIKRAWFAVKRKPVRTILILIVFTAIANFVFAGIAIQHGTETARIMARQKLGGTITLIFDMQKALEEFRSEVGLQIGGLGPGGGAPGGLSPRGGADNPVGGMIVGQAGPGNVRSVLMSQAVSEDGALRLSEHPDIVDYNLIISTTALAGDFEPVTGGEDYNQNGRFTIINPIQGSEGMSVFMPDIRITGVNASVLLDKFSDGTDTLLEGHHIEADKNGPVYEALIEKNLAAQNELKVGDKITIIPASAGLRNNASQDNTLEDVESDVNSSGITLTIAGMYEAGSTTDSSIGGIGRIPGISFMQPYNILFIIVLQQQAKKTSSLIDQTLQLSYTNGSGDIFSKSFFRMHLMKSVSSILLFF